MNLPSLTEHNYGPRQPRDHRHQKLLFVSHPPSSPIQPPRPCARAFPPPRRPSEALHHDHAISPCDQLPTPLTPVTPYMSPSLSMNANNSPMTTVSSIDLEKSKVADERNSWVSTSDPEKAMNRPLDSHFRLDRDDTASLAYSEGGVGNSRMQEEKALTILLFLSGPCFLLSAINAAWTCVALLITLLMQPLRLCSRRPSFAQQLTGLVGPALDHQFRYIYATISPPANEDIMYHTPTLVAVHLLSPPLSLVMVLVAWVVATYWVSSSVVDAPAEIDKRDDGREAVLALRWWWEKWLLKSVRGP